MVVYRGVWNTADRALFVNHADPNQDDRNVENEGWGDGKTKQMRSQESERAKAGKKSRDEDEEIETCSSERSPMSV